MRTAFLYLGGCWLLPVRFLLLADGVDGRDSLAWGSLAFVRSVWGVELPSTVQMKRGCPSSLFFDFLGAYGRKRTRRACTVVLKVDLLCGG